MKKKFVSWGCMLALLGGLCGCGKKIPSDVIQPEVMEPLLYDYHLATTLSADLAYNENYKKDAYLNYVFQKHQVTEAEFDSSMVWYSRHTVHLTAIYDNLQKRFDEEGRLVRKYVDRRSGQTSLTLVHDTVDIDRLYWLSSSDLTNKMTFELKTDTSFRVHDALEWTADFKFLSKAKQADAKAIMGLNFTFDNDSTQGITHVVTKSGRQKLQLKADSAFAFKTVNGFIYYLNESSERGSVLISDIHLIRHHDTGADASELSAGDKDKGLTPKKR